jgi:hypothetical protein
MNPTSRIGKAQTLGTIIGLTVLILNAAPVRSAVVSDFDDGMPDWDQVVLRGVTFSESDGRLVAGGTIPARNYCMTANLSSLRWYESVAVREGEVFVLRADLLESNHDDVQALLTYVNIGGGGYSLVKDQDVIWLTKFQWVDCGANAPFFYEQVPTKNERVRLVLELKKAGTSLEITSKVLDLDDAYAVLFEKTVTDTAAVDPTVAALRGYSLAADAGAPIVSGTAVALDVLNVADTIQSSARVVFDNLTYERQPVLSVEKAVRLSWPASFTGMEVLGAPTVDGPWTTIAEPVIESAGNYLMTVPSPLSETLRVFRLEGTPGP